MRSLLLAAALLAPSTAMADSIVASGGDDAPMPRRVEGRLGMLIGGADVGDADGFSIGASASLGYRMRDVTLRGMFDYYRVGDSPSDVDARSGRAARLGGAVRYAFASTADEERRGHDVAVEFWGELGAGYEHIMWRKGGILDRPSGELAVGFELDARGDADRQARRRHIGYFMDFRTLVGEGPDTGEMPTCGGPCSKATAPSRIDVSMFFELGVHWGR